MRRAGARAEAPAAGEPPLKQKQCDHRSSRVPIANHAIASSARPRSRLRRLLFAFAPPADAWATAVLRGHQLMEIVRRLEPEIECRAVSLTDLMQLRAERVVLTKSALLVLTRDRVLELRSLGHRLAADFIDMKIDRELASQAHCLIASSFSQAKHLHARLPDVPVFHVTHHVDLRLPPIPIPRDRARFGYFGKLQNCLHGSALADFVRVVAVTDPLDVSWYARLAENNAHYAIRAAEPQDGFKPFMKGFVAAHCGAPIVIAADDEEAKYYLDADYPFRVRDLSLRPLREQIRSFADLYMSPAWKRGLAAMKEVAARSSRQQVELELRLLLGAI
jgi:hypothetical protein